MILHTPSPQESFPPVLPVGNDFLSLPHIDPATGAVPDVYVISDRAGGLLGLRGRTGPLLRIVTRERAGAIAPFVPERADREDGWMPVLKGRAGTAPMTVRIIPPPQERGCAIAVDTEPEREVGLEVTWEEVVLAIFGVRALPVRLSMRWDAWTSSLCGEALGALPVVGWAVAVEGATNAFEVEPTADGWRAIVLQRAGRDRRVKFVVAVAPEEDGARTTAVHLRRMGTEAMLRETRRWLRERHVRLTDPALEARANLNLLFNRFFATGRAIDSERPRALTSRSPRYYVSGAFWARDALLWSLPGLLVQDPDWAVTVLREILQTTWPQGAEHALYLTGTHLYPGFELDQLCAYPVAIDAVRAAVPAALWDEAVATDVLDRFPDLLGRHLDQEVGLYRTFLDPSDDPPPHPFLTYDNVLAWRAIRICGASSRARRAQTSRDQPELRVAARALRAAIRRHCVVPGPLGPMYAWAVDGRGQHTLYDNPGGSLLLLPYYGFCRSSDPVWRNTLRWVYATENPFFVPGPFAAPGNRHALHPWPMAACHLILCGQTARGVDFLRRAEMDGGIACETVDTETGCVRTGGAFATLAGYVGAVLHRAWKAR